MTAPGQVITATPPAAPRALTTVPAPPTTMVAVPTAPIRIIDSSLVPVIPPYLTASLSGTATLTAVFTPAAKLPGTGAGSGALSVAVQFKQPTAANFGSTGTIATKVAAGPGTSVVVSAPFATEGLLRPIDAAFGTSGGLSVVTVPYSTALAAFWSTGVPYGIVPINVTAAFGTAGSSTGVTGQFASLTGSGALSCAAVKVLTPSGMKKTGTQTTPTTTGAWATVAGWTPDATYPGSVVTGNALVAQGAKASATVSASVAWTTNNAFGNQIQLQLMKNGTLIGSAGTASSSSPSTVSVNTSIAVNDQITVQVSDASTWASNGAATITTAAGTYVRMS